MEADVGEVTAGDDAAVVLAEHVPFEEWAAPAIAEDQIVLLPRRASHVTFLALTDAVLAEHLASGRGEDYLTPTALGLAVFPPRQRRTVALNLGEPKHLLQRFGRRSKHGLS